LEKLVGAGEPTKIQNVILAAPDLDKLEFKEVVEIIHNIPRRLTLYASAKDKALQASMALHRYPRAGEAGGNLVTLPCLDASDASDVDTDFLGHSLALTDRFVLGDVFELLRRGTAPDGRFGLQRIDHGVTGPHWAFRS
jgi:esterase/lipase superfamily enzyme